MNRKENCFNWVDEFNGAVTICNRQGVIVYMNQQSEIQFKNTEAKSCLGKVSLTAIRNRHGHSC